jgi:outer membrane autotransporter protein
MFRFGIFGGYTDSDVDYDSLDTSADLRGPLVGGYVAYSSGGFYVDAMGRADFLKMDFDSPTIPGGFDGADEDVTSIGVLANVGYRHEMGNAFIEPIGSFAYVNSDMGSFEVSGSKVSFSGDESMRVGGGGRIGGTLITAPDHAVEASILGKVWHEFEDNTVTITDPFGAHTEVSDDAKDIFGELTGSVTAYGLDRSWSVFVSGGAKFNSDFVTYGGKGGIRYAF